MKTLSSLAAILVVSVCVSSTVDALIWTDGFEDGGSGGVAISSAFPGIWSGTGTQVAVHSENFAVRPAGMDVSTRAAYGPTSGNYLSTRSLGADFTDGVVGVEGWLSSRSQTPNNSNYAALGLSSVEMTGVGVSDLMLRYLWSTDAIQMWNGVSSTLTSGDAYGTGASSPDYTNADPDNYNQWQHVLLEVDLDANIARAYLDANQATAGGPWTQLGTDQDISGLGITSIGYASILLSRDGNVDDMTTHRGSIIPEPATLSVLALGGLCLLRRRR